MEKTCLFDTGEEFLKLHHGTKRRLNCVAVRITGAF